MKKKNLELYALLDVATLKKHSKNIEWFVSNAKKLNATIIQYRNKTNDKNIMIDDLKLLKSLCDIDIIVNDNLSLVEYCDGIHLGQEDILKYGEDINIASLHVREKIGKKIFGLTVHNEEEILIANNLCIDYVGLGAYRATNTKDVSNILGEKADILANLSKKDVAIIGGVKLTDSFKNAKYIVVGSNLYEN
ncbi:MAG: thiamine phosphate synthase [Campylobacteraceae bacterium]|jgi:thiamine-phosphate pyrophosphorylase|nr:thiamine phosphate synthase [Campylobacteraceae bacterium]